MVKLRIYAYNQTTSNTLQIVVITQDKRQTGNKQVVVNLELVLSANNSVMSTRHVCCVGASVLLDVQTARQRLESAVYDAN